MMDAANAFNSLNRASMKLEVFKKWPSAARFVSNCYGGDALMVTNNREDNITSREGVTQGDPLSMHCYAIATLPLIRQTRREGVMQAWHADDGAGAGENTRLRDWMISLIPDRAWSCIRIPSRAIQKYTDSRKS